MKQHGLVEHLVERLSHLSGSHVDRMPDPLDRSRSFVSSRGLERIANDLPAVPDAECPAIGVVAA